MFNLEQSITEWRRQMTVGGVKIPAVLDELEGHLREEVRVQMAGGVSEREAFEAAVAGIGNAKSVRAEFDKIKGAASLPLMISMSVWGMLAALIVFLVLRQMAKGRFGPLMGIHVFAVMMGFLGAFVVGSLGVCYLWRQLFGALSPDRGGLLRRAASVFIQISLAFTVVGYLLGMFYTSKYRGFYWSGSFKEIGALCTILWFVALVVIQQFKRVDEYSLMLLCAGSNVVVAMGWFGAGILVVDPRLTHFLNYWPLEIFVIAHLLFIAMSFGRGLRPVQS
jgi:hypothetical protein